MTSIYVKQIMPFRVIECPEQSDEFPRIFVSQLVIQTLGHASDARVFLRQRERADRSVDDSHPYGRRQPFAGNIGKNQHGLSGTCPEDVEEVSANLVGRQAFARKLDTSGGGLR